MRVGTSYLEGILIIEPGVFHDDRGYFFENFKRTEWGRCIDGFNIVQQNTSASRKNVVRGLHYQKGGHAQGKIVSVPFGRILDVAVDMRKDSDTFGKYFSVELSDENPKLLYIPKGFAHGFSVLSDRAVVSYLTDAEYNHESERGVRFNDPNIGINWGISYDDAIISSKDKVLPFLRDITLEDLF